MLTDYYILNNGVKIPKVGLGTWFITDNTAEVVKDAIEEANYRHIDTAQAYANEVGVGEGVRKANIDREEIFITSKVAAELKTYDSAIKSIDKTIQDMGLEYIDMMIIHSPQPWSEFRNDNKYFKENIEVWRALEDSYKEGKVKAIGVSNFLIDDLENILNNCTIKPMVNQILLHIGNTPIELIDFCTKNDILVEAYSPIAHGEALKNEKIIEMARKYNISVAQLCIKYVVELGTVALPKTANVDHMKENGDINFEISEEDMQILKTIDTKEYGEYSYFPVFSGK